MLFDLFPRFWDAVKAQMKEQVSLVINHLTYYTETPLPAPDLTRAPTMEQGKDGLKPAAAVTESTTLLEVLHNPQRAHLFAEFCRAHTQS